MPDRESKEKTGGVKSITKAFLLMEELDKAGELSIGELSERLSMDKATVHRLVNTIKDSGFINQNLDTKKYANSLKLLAMGNRVMEKLGIKHIARPIIEDLAQKAGETINLGVLVDNKIMYIDKLECTSTIKVGLGVGTTVPCYCSGLGKAILAFTSEPALSNLLDTVRFETFTDSTIADRDAFLRDLSLTKERGYSLDDEEYVVGLICIGAPVFDFHGNPVAAVTVSCPKYRYDKDRHLSLFSTLAMNAARNISLKLGYKA